MQKLSGKSLLLVSFTLFSMFFGAGNLIFPPHLGAQADGADGKARKGRPEAGTGLCAQMRRENQVPGSEKHGK